MTITNTLYQCAKQQSFQPLLKHRQELEIALQLLLAVGDKAKEYNEPVDIWLHVEYIADRWMCSSRIAWLLKQLDENENV